MKYSHLKEAQIVWAQLRRAIDAGEEHLVDVHAVGDWLRTWLDQVPCDPA
jgi:hypothetical protein